MLGLRLLVGGVLFLLTISGLGATTVTLNSLSGTTSSQLNFSNLTYQVDTETGGGSFKPIDPANTGFGPTFNNNTSAVLAAGPNNGLNATIDNTLPGSVVVTGASLVWAVNTALSLNASYLNGSLNLPAPVLSTTGGTPNPATGSIAFLTGIQIGSATYNFPVPVSSFSGNILALNGAFASELAAGNDLILLWQQVSASLQLSANNSNYTVSCNNCTTQFNVTSSIGSSIAAATGLTVDYNVVQVVPEPSSYALIASGLMLLGIARRRIR